jgi:hypothetical protein
VSNKKQSRGRACNRLSIDRDFVEISRSHNGATPYDTVI